MDKVARVGAALLRRGLGSVAETARGGAPSTTGGWYANLANPTQCTRLGAFGPATRGYVSSTLPRFADDRFSPVFETPEMDKEYERLAVEIGKAPKKRQRFLLTEALKGTRLKPLIAAERELLKEDDEFKPGDRREPNVQGHQRRRFDELHRARHRGQRRRRGGVRHR